MAQKVYVVTYVKYGTEGSLTLLASSMPRALEAAIKALKHKYVSVEHLTCVEAGVSVDVVVR